MTNPLEYKLDFSNQDWVSTAPGIRSKSIENGVKKVRLLELEKGLNHPHWCETGHIGFVVEGTIEIIFDGESVEYTRGDGLFIPQGTPDRHIPKPLTDKVVLFMVEDA